MTVLVHPAAEAELVEAVTYYAAIDPALGERFYLEMKRLLEEVYARPRMFRQFDPPARRHFSPSFPYGVIYFERLDHLWIVAIMHVKRRPGFWKTRLGSELSS